MNTTEDIVPHPCWQKSTKDMKKRRLKITCKVNYFFAFNMNTQLNMSTQNCMY